MNCKLCKRELTDPEHFAYSGKCEVCWSGLVANLPPRQVVGRGSDEVRVTTLPDRSDKTSHRKTKVLGKRNTKYLITDPVEKLKEILVPEEVMACVFKSRIIHRIKKLMIEKEVPGSKLSLMADCDEGNVRRALRGEAKVSVSYLFRLLIALGGTLEDICATDKCTKDQEIYLGVKYDGWK